MINGEILQVYSMKIRTLTLGLLSRNEEEEFIYKTEEFPVM